MIARLTDLAYLLGWRLVKLLPERWANALFRMIGDRVWRKRGKGVRRLEANLARVVGPGVSAEELSALSRDAMRSYMRYWCETFRLPIWSRERIDSTFMCHDEHILREALASGRGVILALPHTGNWDHAGAWVTGLAGQFTTVAERFTQESLFNRFVAYRESLGMEVLPHSGGSGVFGTMARRLRSGRLVCLLVDRDLTPSGVEVTFFGEKAKMPTVAPALAIQTGAVLLPVVLWYDDDGTHAQIYPEVPVPAEGDRATKAAQMTQRVADAFADGIGKHPADWHMLQRLWLADLDPAAAPDGVAEPAAER